MIYPDHAAAMRETNRLIIDVECRKQSIDITRRPCAVCGQVIQVSSAGGLGASRSALKIAHDKHLQEHAA